MDIHRLVVIFCEIDDFCKELDQYNKHPLLSGSTKGSRGPECCLAISEIMTILVMFQMSGYRDFKWFYQGFLQTYWRDYFPYLPSYPRFITLLNRAIFPFILFMQIKSGKKTNIYYIDSSCLPVSHLKRSKQHKTFEEVAEYGHTLERIAARIFIIQIYSL